MIKKIFVHESSFVDTPEEIGEGTKIWHFSHIMKGSKIGKNCIIGQNVFISKGAIIGNNVKIQNNVSIYEGIECYDNVFIGPSVVFTNVINPRSFIERKLEFKQTILHQGSSIGANATIICGCEIGKYSLVGAGSVVTSIVEDYSIVVGNPARRTGWISESGYKLNFDKSDTALCSFSKEKYIINNDKVEKINHG